MKQNLILFTILLFGLFGCKNNAKEVIIKGEIKGFGSDTIYIYGNDELSDLIEPVSIVDDKFSITLPIDTLTEAMLFISDQETYPIYLENSKTIQVKGNINTPGVFEIKGNQVNEELTAFNKRLSDLENPSDTLITQLIEDYIQHNQRSLINIYLLDKYFVRVPSPDLSKIKGLIGIMDGTLQDKPYIEKLNEFIEDNEKAEVNKIAATFNITTIEGKKISRTDFKDKYLLITFWASWCDSCKTSNRELKQVYKTYPPKKKPVSAANKKKISKDPELAILGVSLDFDKDQWEEAVKQDTLKWEQANDLAGWNSTMVKQYAVNEIPYNILVDSKWKIIARGIKGEELNQKLKELLKPEK